MKAYRIKGKFEMGWMKGQIFVKEVAAKTPDEAAELLYSVIGSKHKVKRRQIKIEKIEEIPLEQVENLIVKQAAGAKNEK